MGWVKESAKAVGIKSLLALAKKMSADPEAKRIAAKSVRGNLKGTTLSVGSLRNYLADLEQGKAGWWASTGAKYRPILARVLNLEVGELERQIQGVSEAGLDVRFGFSSFPELSPLDLRTEAPFPGVPFEITDFGSTPRHFEGWARWWHGSAGAGKSIVGHWLILRGWQCYDGWTKVPDPLPESGKIFVELRVQEEIPTSIKLPAALNLLIAAPFPAPQEEQGTLWGGVENVRSERESWKLALIDWVNERLPPGDQTKQFLEFDLKSNLEEHQEVWNSIATPGDLLGFLGVLYAFGAKRVFGGAHPIRAEHLLRLWIERQIERRYVQLSQPRRKYLEEQGAALILRLEKGRLLANLPIEVPDTEIQALIASEELEGVARATLLDPNLSEKQAAQHLHSYRQRNGKLKILHAVGWLRETQPGRWAVQPRWFEPWMREAIVRDVWAAGEIERCRLLLNPETSAAALQCLRSELYAGTADRWLDRIAQLDPDDPEAMVLLDAMFRAVGLALLERRKVPQVLVEAVWARMGDCAVQRVFPEPLIAVGYAGGQGHDAWTLTREAWWICGIAISETLEDRQDRLAYSVLNPWKVMRRDAESWRGCRAMLVVLGHMTRFVSEQAQLDLFALGGRLLDRIGLVTEGGTRESPSGRMVRMQAPDGLVVLSRENREPAAEIKSYLADLDFGLKAIDNACERRRANVEEVLWWCWKHLWTDGHGAPFASAGTRHVLTEDDQRRIWQALDQDLPLESILRLCSVATRETAAAGKMPEWIWDRGAQAWIDDTDDTGFPIQSIGGSEDTFWRAVPKAILIRALRESRPGRKGMSAMIEVACERAPDDVLGLLEMFAREPPRGDPLVDDSRLSVAMRHLPLSMSVRLTPRVAQWREQSDTFPGAYDRVKWWMGHAIERRLPGWRGVYSVLAEDMHHSLN